MVFSVTHITNYTYNAPVSHGHNIATLRARDSQGQKLLDYQMDIDPTPSEVSERLDFFGNYITRFSIQEEHTSLKVTTKSLIERNFDSFYQMVFSDACSSINLARALELLKTNSPEVLEAKQFILDSIFIRRANKRIRDYAQVSFRLIGRFLKLPMS